MKRSRICYLLVIIAMLTTTNVFALQGWSFCSLNQGSSIKYSTNNAYEYHIQQVIPQGGGERLRMFCTYPQKSSGTPNPQTTPPNITCDMVSTTNFPTSYKLLKLIQTRGYSNDRVLDIAFRMAGIYDRVNNGTLVINQGSNYQMKAFYNTYLTKVLGQTNTGFDQFYLIGGEVDEAVQLLKDSKDLDISDINPSANPTQNQTGIFTLELLSEEGNTKIYRVNANREINNTPTVTPSNIHYEWLEWNKTTGRIKLTTLSDRNCNGAITISANVDVGNSSAIYDCHSNSTGWQNYIAIGPSQAGDTFSISTCEEPECIKSGCGVVEKSTELKETDIHNCCEDGAITKVRQAALNELFCKDGNLNIDYYKEKCNADEYIVFKSDFCKEYCGATAMYQLPGPTHAKSDAYFFFSKERLGITGPILNQYKRCRTIIYFDQWISAYKTNNESAAQALNDYNKYITEYNLINGTSGQSHTESYTVTCTNPTTNRPVASTDSFQTTKYNVHGGSYKRYKISLDGAYTKLNVSADSDGTIGASTYYASDAAEKYNALVERHPGCTISGNSSFPNYDQAKSNARDLATRARANYDALVGASNDLRNKLTTCTGKADANGVVDTSELKERVAFHNEPEMEFSYNQVFLNDVGKLTSQEVKIDFEKIDGKCAYHVYDTLDKPNKNSDDWNKNWDIIGIYDDQYSSTKYGNSKVLAIDTLKGIGNATTQITDINTIHGSNDKFYASKKFTTDAVGHMSCRWQDAKDNKTYTLIPSGIVRTEMSGDIKDLGPNYTEHTGTYHIVKTHATGKFETYFTLRNIADGGIFDDIVHNGGKTCDELYADVKGSPKGDKADEVNATCYIDIKSNGWTIYNCTQADVVSPTSQEDLEKICCDNPPCEGSSLLEYKEIDPSDPFPNEHGSNYAVNWLDKDDAKAQETLNRIKTKAKDDTTYSKEEMTYSFTLKPSDLKDIRAYNKSRIKAGGYTDFEMDCDKVENNGVVTLERCKSRFITAISGGSGIDYGTGILKLKTNNIDLSTSRQSWN